MSDATSPPVAQCVLDSSIVNEETLGDMDDIALSVFATLCGKNRGAFVLDPPDGQTYGCLKFPEQFGEVTGLPTTNTSSLFKDETTVVIADSNDVNQQFVGGNITAATALTYMQLLTKAVYGSTADVDQDPYACSVNGLAKLECESTVATSPFSKTVRSVTLAGLFSPASWATNGKTLTLDQAKTAYTMEDFEQMASLGLNTVLIPIDDEIVSQETQEAVSAVLSMAKQAGLDAILSMDGTNSIAAATFSASQENVIALQLAPSADEAQVTQARAVAPDLTLMVSINGGDLKKLSVPTDNVYAALDMSHSSTVADVASSTSEDDRSKLFYHEAVACTGRSPIEFAQCYRNVPVFVTSGFDLSIDNCNLQGYDETFHDFGQCDRFEETLESGWWFRHRASFAERQLFSLEQGLGWSFTTWKLLMQDSEDDSEPISKPAHLMALKNVAAAGLFPALTEGDSTPALLACLNPPEPDFILGDDTLAPTMGPPPDCGDGWWNYNISDCEYWIPPTPTTLNVTCPPCEVCPSPIHDTTVIYHSSKKQMAESFLGGVLTTLALGFVVYKVIAGRSKDRNEYTAIPEYQNDIGAGEKA